MVNAEDLRLSDSKNEAKELKKKKGWRGLTYEALVGEVKTFSKKLDPNGEGLNIERLQSEKTLHYVFLNPNFSKFGESATALSQLDDFVKDEVAVEEIKKRDDLLFVVLEQLLLAIRLSGVFTFSMLWVYYSSYLSSLSSEANIRYEFPHHWFLGVFILSLANEVYFKHRRRDATYVSKQLLEKWQELQSEFNDQVQMYGETGEKVKREAKDVEPETPVIIENNLQDLPDEIDENETPYEGEDSKETHSVKSLAEVLKRLGGTQNQNS